MSLFHKRHPPVGSRPGTLMIPETAPEPRIRITDYGPEGMEEREIADVEEIPAFLDTETVTWVDVQGIGDEALIRRVGEIFSIHALALEDAVNVPQRPKSESYEQHQLFITRMGRIEPRELQVQTEQVSIFLGPSFVLTLQERHGDVFDPVRARIRAGKGPIRRSGADYLAYALIDTVIDGYFPILEELEDATLEDARKSNLRRIYRAKRQLLELRRAVWPQREAVNSLIRDENPLVSAQVRIYLRDCYDHAVQVIDVTETFRELTSNLMDIYLSAVSQRTNEVMKVLTIIGSIFIPLTFLAGIYGMNFEYMPELAQPWAYPAVLVLMLIVALGMVGYFWRRGWIGERDEE
jgi:magnesium transporter